MQGQQLARSEPLHARCGRCNQRLSKEECVADGFIKDLARPHLEREPPHGGRRALRPGDGVAELQCQQKACLLVLQHEHVVSSLPFPWRGVAPLPSACWRVHLANGQRAFNAVQQAQTRRRSWRHPAGTSSPELPVKEPTETGSLTARPLSCPGGSREGSEVSCAAPVSTNTKGLPSATSSKEYTEPPCSESPMEITLPIRGSNGNSKHCLSRPRGISHSFF